MLYIADTHSLVWFLSEDSQLGEKAKKIFENVEQGKASMVIPTIVLAELLYLCERKRMQKIFTTIIKKIKEGTNYFAYDLDVDVIIACQNLEKVPEMHDKIITATAQLLDATVLTKDPHITDCSYVKIMW